MTESNQGPATPGTAARCEELDSLRDLLRIVGAEITGALAHFKEGTDGAHHLDWLEPHIAALRAEGRLGEPQVSAPKAPLDSVPEIGRLKAENASLLESLRAAEKLAESRGRMLSDSMALHEQANHHLFAAEQRNTALEGALRAINDVATQMRERLASYKGGNWYPKVGDYTLVINHKCRAALHDEERSAPPQEAGPTCSAVFDEFLCGRTAGHDGKHCDFHTADSPTMWDPIAAAQGEEK